MPEPGSRADEDELLRRVRELEARVGRLERCLEPSADRSGIAGAPIAPAPRIALAESATAVRALGRALLGIAGAYVLRALTEGGQLPQAAGVFAAIIYATSWLVWAARGPADRRAESAFYGLTAGLILGPLLWEATLRFRVISTRTAAATLLVFTLFGMILSWRKRLRIVTTIATVTGVLTAVALLMGSHDVAPFLCLLLAVAAAVEVSACLDHWLSERWLTAIAADLVVALVLYLLSDRRGLPESYVPISRAWFLVAPLVLAGIYFSSVLVRTLFRRSVITWFEAGQLALAFLFVMAGAWRPGDPGIVAAVCFGCGAVCYAAGSAFGGRNLHAYLSLGLVLIAAGTAMALPAAWVAVSWSGLAVIGMAATRPVFHWHGGAYLLLSFTASGVLARATEILLSGSDHPGVPAALLAQTGVALVCCAVAGRAGNSEQLLQAVLAAAFFWTAAGTGAATLASAYHAVFGVLAPHAYCSTIRTVVMAAGAMLVAAAGSLGKRPALMPLVYPVMILGAYRLLLVDLRQDNKTAFVFSLLAYGAALIVLPRLMAPPPTAAR